MRFGRLFARSLSNVPTKKDVFLLSEQRDAFHIKMRGRDDIRPTLERYLSSKEKAFLEEFILSFPRPEEEENYEILLSYMLNLERFHVILMQGVSQDPSLKTHPAIQPLIFKRDAYTPIQRLQWQLHEILHSKHEMRVNAYLKEFQKMSRPRLLSLVGHLRSELENHALDNMDKKAKLEAVQKTLNPTFRRIYYLGGGVFDAKAIQVNKKNGYETILLCPREERTLLAASIADRVVPIEDSTNISEIMQAIEKDQKTWGKEPSALTPGYGKLSEKFALPAACEARDIYFIGPNSEMLKIISDKTAVKALAVECGVPVIPGYFSEAQDRATMIAHAKPYFDRGKKLVLKEGRSGGGYGNFVVETLEEFIRAYDSFRARDKEGPIFFEIFLENPRHIEVQIATTRLKLPQWSVTPGEVLVLYYRNCSIQRRFQKSIEEAPGQVKDPAKVLSYAKKLGQKILSMGGTNVATLEFLEEDGEYYFMEVNYRVQVEHGPTELIHYPLSILELNPWISSRRSMQEYFQNCLEKLGIFSENKGLQEMADLLRQNSPYQYAIEARVEMVEEYFDANGILQEFPVKGEITHLSLPADVYTSLQVGSEVDTKTLYKLAATPIGLGKTREEALANLLDKLSKIRIEGVQTNVPRLIHNVQYLINHPECEIHTGTAKILDEHYRKQIQDSKVEVAKSSPAAFFQAHYPDGEAERFSAISRAQAEKSEVDHTTLGIRNGSWD